MNKYIFHKVVNNLDIYGIIRKNPKNIREVFTCQMFTN
jgi:hypothetical protein